jgi:hypothetical protein
VSFTNFSASELRVLDVPARLTFDLIERFAGRLMAFRAREQNG